MKVLLLGFGKMNQLIFDLFEENIVGICDVNRFEIREYPDVIIDFSHSDFFPKVLEMIEKFQCPTVIGTTNYDKEKIAQIREISKNIPILMSSNFSVGIYLLEKMLKENEKILSMFDKEIIETHHTKKLTSPSGTALSLSNILNTDKITFMIIVISEMCIAKSFFAFCINKSHPVKKAYHLQYMFVKPNMCEL